MRIASVTISGFRGVRDTVQLVLPPGFAVVTGRNGSGKSTLCDAIEFAFTGTIRGGSKHKEKGENIEDYLWWRGSGEAKFKEVSVGLVAPDGSTFTVTRTPDGDTTSFGGDLESILCDGRNGVKHGTEKLCRTTIVRDEEITTISVDLAETDRFEFVRSALGTVDFSDVEEKCKKVQAQIDQRAVKLSAEYELLRKQISDLTTRISAAKTEAVLSPDVASAERVLREALGSNIDAESEIIPRAQQRVAELRVAVDNLLRVSRSWSQLQSRRQQVLSSHYLAQLDEKRLALAKLRAELSDAEKKHAIAAATVADREQGQPRLATLAQLHSQGKRLGLEAGHCPLCGSTVDVEAFDKHLQQVAQIVSQASSDLQQAIKERDDSEQAARQIRVQISVLEGEERTLSQAGSLIEEEEARLRTSAQQYGYVSSEDFRPETLAVLVEATRELMSKLERAVATLDASRQLERVARMERELVELRANCDTVEARGNRCSDALKQIKDALAAIKRTRGEIVEDQLAQLTPLIDEIYARLRPHVDWAHVGYRLRGDVRRFLSFEVGDGLNPSFLFSSGQRRAAGLAFLFAVHLSREWCKLRTLILDDPVQHVDDFRALHLAEVLASVRRNNRQIVCTVEDEPLAELLCRRLRSEAGDEGCLIQMEYESTQGVHLKSQRRISPISSNILVSA
ncbi:MAG TPA: AAA family ATPase [Tepidisphaeraceae bacterium]